MNMACIGLKTQKKGPSYWRFRLNAILCSTELSAWWVNSKHSQFTLSARILCWMPNHWMLVYEMPCMVWKTYLYERNAGIWNEMMYLMFEVYMQGICNEGYMESCTATSEVYGMQDIWVQHCNFCFFILWRLQCCTVMSVAYELHCNV